MNLTFQDSIHQQVRNHLLDQTEISEQQRERVREIEKKVDDLLREFAEARRHIQNDGRLISSAKTDDIAKLTQDYAVRLKHITDSEVTQIAKRLAELETELRPQPPATDPTLQFLKEQEIRTHLRTMDELQLIVSYQDWAVTGQDDDSMRAVENAPAAFPLISDPSILEAGKAARGARRSPKAAQFLKQLRQKQGLLRNIIRSAEAQIDLPADDPVALIAAGETENPD